MIKRSATAIWEGSIKEGKGSLTTQSGTLERAAYTFVSRFDNADGTNPEELIAAAHAGCFSMMLSNLLGEARLAAKRIETRAEVTLDSANGRIVASHLFLKAQVPGVDKDKFAAIAKNAERNCPVSRLLNADIKLDYELTQ